ncbi:MAG: endonuclease/exonuclease/phosphatase family protein [Solirubrobacterales bacterium]
MREVSEIGALARPRAVLVAALSALIALTALVATPGADAKPKPKKAVAVKLMTRNIFLGADLTPALTAPNAQEFVRANGAILREVDQTDFPRRAIGLAREIKQTKPDLIGLQEAAWWRTNPTPGAPAQGPNGQFTATTDKYNFLQILLDALDARGLDYEIGVEKVEFDFEAPTDYDNNPNTGLAGGEIQGRLTMRDVILVNEDSRVNVKLKNPQSGTYSSLFTPTIAGFQVPVTRGWTAGDVTVKKGKGKNEVKRKFRFVNTHFEAFDDETQRPSIRAQQATEAVNGPASKKRTIMLGDFNSDVPGVKPGDEQAFQVILDAGFARRATDDPLSCCVSNLFTSPRSEFDHQVDHIVSNMGKKAKLVNSSVTGREQVNGIYDSDHAGVVSKLKLK